MAPHRHILQARLDHFKRTLQRIEQTEGGLLVFSKGYEHYGFKIVYGGKESSSASIKAVRYREWAPGATSASLVGDFNGWNRAAHPMQRDSFERWRVDIAASPGGELPIPHGSRVKVMTTSWLASRSA